MWDIEGQNYFVQLSSQSLMYLHLAPEYKYYATPETWLRAESECQRWEGHLVTISSQAENDYIADQITSR